jgi:hypothetical protein
MVQGGEQRVLDKLRVATGFTVLLTLILVGWQWRRVNAQETMRIIDLPDSGLKLVQSQDPNFNNLIKASLAGEAVPELDALKPYTVILQNNSSSVLVAYAVRWEYTKPDGRRAHVDYSDGQVGRLLDGAIRKPITPYDEGGAMLYPHSFVVVTPTTTLKTASGARDRASDPNYQALLQKLASRFSQGQDVSATLDGAFFEDGSFVGANNTHFFEKFTSEVRARQNLAQRIVESIGQGRSVRDVAREIQESLPAVPPKLALAPEGTLQGYDDYYKHEYASAFLSVYRNSGQEAALAWAQSNLFRNPPRLSHSISGGPKP